MFLIFVAAVLADIKYSYDYPSNQIGQVTPVFPVFSRQFAAVISGENRFQPSLYYNCRDSNTWALTFDDGPSIYTPTLLNSLRDRGIKATFMVIGANALKHPEILQQIVADGHEIGVHTWSHPYLTQLSHEQIVTEVMLTYNVIKDITGKSCNIFRPPYGNVDNGVLSLLNGLGFKVIQWDLDTKDWQSNGASTVPNFSNWVNEQHQGHISLEHDSFDGTVAAAPYAMDLVTKAGYQTALISQCVGFSSVYGELNGNFAAVAANAVQDTNSANAPSATSAGASASSASTATTTGTSLSSVSTVSGAQTGTKSSPSATASANAAQKKVFILDTVFLMLAIAVL